MLRTKEDTFFFSLDEKELENATKKLFKFILRLLSNHPSYGSDIGRSMKRMINLSEMGEITAQKHLMWAFLRGIDCKKDYIRGYELVEKTDRSLSATEDTLVVAFNKLILTSDNSESDHEVN